MSLSLLQLPHRLAQPIFRPRWYCSSVRFWRFRRHIRYLLSRSWYCTRASGFHFRPGWMKMTWRWTLTNIIKSNVLFIDDLLVSKHDSLVVKIKTYLKSDVLSMLSEVLIALMTEAKHWFSITSTFLLASSTSLTAQSSTYLKHQS